MGKKHLLPQSNEEFLRRLGLTEIDTKVYIATLDGGLVSLGEIQQLTEINDLGKILESVRDLIDVGLVKKAQGTMRRYYATLPFLRETLSVEREFRFALEAMIQSLNQAKTTTTQNRERIVAVQFPKIVDTLLDRYYKEILQPVLKELEEVRDQVKSGLLPFIKEVDAENSSFKDEIISVIQPLNDYSQLLTQAFSVTINRESSKFEDFIASRRQSRLALLKKGHNSISSHLQAINSEITKLTDNYRQEISSLQDQINNVTEISSSLSSSVSSFESVAGQISNAKKELQAELVVAREQLKRAINSGEISIDKVDQVFSSLNDKIAPVNFTGDDLLAVMTSASGSVNELSSKLEITLSNFTQAINTTKDSLVTSFETLKAEMGEVFNELNDTDESSLIDLKDQIEKNIEEFSINIKKEGEQVQTRVKENISRLEENQEKIMDTYQEKMVSLFGRPGDIINPFLDEWLDKVATVIEDFKKQSEDALVEILEPIHELEEGTFSILTERIGFVRAMVEGRSNDLQQVLEHAKNFDFTKSADTSVVVGLPAIYASLTDLLLRTKTRVTVVTPNLDLEIAEMARNLKNTIRVTLVTDIDPDKDARLVKKLEEIGRIHLRYYPKQDLYACIRDSEEIIFGYVNEGEKTLGIRSATPSIVQLLEDRLNETVIRNSKQF